MTAIPDALVEKAKAAARRELMRSATTLDVLAGRVARAVLATAWEDLRRERESSFLLGYAGGLDEHGDDLPAAQPTVDRMELADAIYRGYQDGAASRDTVPECIAADRVLSLGILTDAAQVRADERRKVADEIAAAIDYASVGTPKEWQYGLRRGAAIAREIGGSHE